MNRQVWRSNGRLVIYYAELMTGCDLLLPNAVLLTESIRDREIGKIFLA